VQLVRDFLFIVKKLKCKLFLLIHYIISNCPKYKITSFLCLANALHTKLRVVMDYLFTKPYSNSEICLLKCLSYYHCYKSK